MKKIILSLTIILLIANCKNTKSGTVATKPSTEPTETELTAAKTKYPNASMESLKQGHDLYFGTCTNCHGAKKITNFSEEEWPGIMNKMARKAKISDAEKEAVLQYVFGVKLAAK